jgi:Homeodomain-like domain
MKPKHRVHLTDEQRLELRRRLAAGRGSARELTRVRILLKSDQSPGGPAWPDGAIAEALDVSVATIERVRKRFVAQGLGGAVRRKPPNRVYARKLDGEREARLVALSCSEPPEGRAHWSMRLLAAKLVELRVIDGVSDETVRRALKKTRSSRG